MSVKKCEIHHNVEKDFFFFFSIAALSMLFNFQSSEGSRELRKAWTNSQQRVKPVIAASVVFLT